MNKTCKKILGFGLGLLLGVSASAQISSAPRFVFQPLLSGYNVNLVSNQVDYLTSTYGAGILDTNILYTSLAGVVGLSYQTVTNINGNYNSNSLFADAFKPVELGVDNNGDIAANASLWYTFGNTNYIPIVSVVNTNPFVFGITNWQLAQSQYPNWLYSSSTNVYPLYPAVATNTVTITLYKGPTTRLNGSSVGPAIPFYETANTFSFTVTLTSGNTMVIGTTNLPVGWLTGAHYVRAVATLTPGYSTNNAVLLNQLGLLQPQP